MSRFENAITFVLFGTHWDWSFLRSTNLGIYGTLKLVQKKFLAKSQKWPNVFGLFGSNKVSKKHFFFSFERVTKVIETVLTVFQFTSFACERNRQKSNSWQKFLPFSVFCCRFNLKFVIFSGDFLLIFVCTKPHPARGEFFTVNLFLSPRILPAATGGNS